MITEWLGIALRVYDHRVVRDSAKGVHHRVVRAVHYSAKGV